MPNDMLRHSLAVLSEELFNAIFRDYQFSYDPRDPTQRMPRLCEEALMNAVPYSAVVQSLRDAAKDAIMRRLELEARCSVGVSVSTSAACMESQAGAADSSTAPDNAASANTVGSVAGSAVVTGNATNAARPGNTAADNNRAVEEVQLREELRHARLLADTYQARTMDLERQRIELEEEVRRTSKDREKEDARHKKLADEVRRLRAEARQVREMQAAYETERAAFQAFLSEGGTGRRGGGGGSGSRRESRRTTPTRRDAELENADGFSKVAPGAARHGLINSADDYSFAPPAEGELPSSRLRIPIDMPATRRNAGTPTSPARTTPSSKSLRSPRGGSNSTTSVAVSEGKPAAADAAGGATRPRRCTTGSTVQPSRSARGVQREESGSKGWR